MFKSLLLVCLGSVQCAAATLLSGCNLVSASDIDYTVIAQYKHDSSAFTEGLALENGHLFEAGGLYNHSFMREIDLNGYKVLRERRLPGYVFGEGIALVSGFWYQLTWRNHVVYVTDQEFSPVKQIPLPGEGWGLARSGDLLLLSDGSAALRYVNPEDFSTVRSITIRDHGRAVTQLNSIDCIGTRIFANVWQTNHIAIIDSKDGRVMQWLNLESLSKGLDTTPGWDPDNNVLNGITHDPSTGDLFVTGKRWPLIFEIKLKQDA